MTKKKKILFLLSHPIQYFSPLFIKMNESEEFDLKVLYCNDYGILKKNIHPEVGEVKGWDIPLLEGYNYKFLKNYSWKPSIFNGFFGLINFEIFNELKNERGSSLIVHGWNYFTNLTAIIFGKLIGLKICIRGDNPYNQEILKNKKLLFLKKIILGKILFNFVDYFLYVGKQNKAFYTFYGVPERKLFFTPHAVDNERFKSEYEKYKDRKPELRKELGLPVDKKIILTAGKYVPKKRPMDLIRAYQLLNDTETALVFLGDGELRNEMEYYISRHILENVYLTGFKNQGEIGKYYAAADIFVLPSGIGETWGLVVNEAMNFSLPIITSDMVGCCDDLIKESENGFVFETGNIDKLSKYLAILIGNDKLRQQFGERSLKIISHYSFENIIYSFKEVLLSN